MSKVVAVIRREVVERVRTRVFMIMTLVLPIFMAAMLVVPALMMKGTDHELALAIVDGTTGGLGASIEQALKKETFSDSANSPRYTVTRVEATGRIDAVRDSLVGQTGLSKKAAAASLDGVLVITDSILVDGKAGYYGSNVGSFDAMGRLQGTLRQLLMTMRLQRAGVDPKVVAGAMGPVDMSTIKVSDGKSTGESGSSSFMLAYVMGFLLYMGVFMYGQQTGGSVVEEKTSRIMEILASSLTPFQMLLGKVIGVGLTGLLQMGIWAATAFILTSQRATLAALAGVDPEAIRSIPVPNMPPTLLAIFLLYFLLGFLMYGALYAGIGAMCNTIQEVQQTAMPVMMLIIFGFFGVFSLLADPTGSLGKTLSIIPFFSPFVMPVRYSLVSVPWTELLLSISLSIAFLLGAIWFAGKIYRTGILMYGKKPGLKEIFRWMRA